MTGLLLHATLCHLLGLTPHGTGIDDDISPRRTAVVYDREAIHGRFPCFVMVSMSSFGQSVPVSALGQPWAGP